MIGEDEDAVEYARGIIFSHDVVNSFYYYSVVMHNLLLLLPHYNHIQCHDLFT